MNRFDKLTKDGFQFFDCDYESPKWMIADAKKKGFADENIKAIRVRTDTRGLPMYEVYVRKG